MNLKRIVFSGAVLIGIGLVLLLVLRPAPRPLLPIVIGRFQSPHSGLIHLAQAQGYFTAEGLSATIRTVRTGHDAIARVLHGELDVGTSAETPFARALALGQQPKIVATIFSARWSSGIVVRRDHGITTPAELKGKRIGFVPGTNTHYDLEAFLAFHQIDLAAVSMVPGQPDALVPALVKGELDAASVWMPFLTQMQQQLKGKVTTFFPSEFYVQTVNLVVRPDYVRLHRRTLDRLLRALLKAQAFAATHPQQANAIIAAASQLEPGALRAQDPSLSYELSLKQALLLATENQVRWYFRRTLVPRAPFPDVLHAVETAPLRALKPAAVTLSQ